MKPTETKTPNLVGPDFTLSFDDETAIFDYRCFPPLPDNVTRIK